MGSSTAVGRHQKRPVPPLCVQILTFADVGVCLRWLQTVPPESRLPLSQNNVFLKLLCFLAAAVGVSLQPPVTPPPGAPTGSSALLISSIVCDLMPGFLQFLPVDLAHFCSGEESIRSACWSHGSHRPAAPKGRILRTFLTKCTFCFTEPVRLPSGPQPHLSSFSECNLFAASCQ